ncbi:MAG: DUF934 domain-containing protein, partial [Rubrivivax sp.]|nr:DUF934 domain-containing protein [Rubrivivax sp.]
MQFFDASAPTPSDTLVLDNTVDVMAHADAVRDAARVWLRFPAWTDGRAYSQAVVLRGRLRFRGQIGATGEVLVDMLPLLRRCGFDAVALAPGQDRAAAERALAGFSDHYQADHHRPQPRYARHG